MNKADKCYIDLLNDIMENGVEKKTRAGDVLSVFGRQLRFDLKEGFPLLTTKKVFMKGITYELLWFLQRPYNSHGSMNIEYLVRNGVHIWDDDAYRWYKEWVKKNREELASADYYRFVVCTGNDDLGESPNFEHWIEGENRKNDIDWFENLTKDEFLDLVLQKVEVQPDLKNLLSSPEILYRFGDLGPVYGTQWRAFGNGIFRDKKNDQIQRIIDTLKTNPNDRRMLCVAFNPGQLDNMALPPCHVMFQFYTREISPGKYGLSCMWTQRSVDVCCGLPFNIASYALLTHIIAHLVGMIPDELVGSLGDCHIYKNHIDGVNEQLKRLGSDTLPTLKIKRKVESIEDFKYDDFQMLGYSPDPPIKYQLNVG